MRWSKKMKIEDLSLKFSKDYHTNIVYYHFECSEIIGEENTSIKDVWNSFLESLSRRIGNEE